MSRLLHLLAVLLCVGPSAGVYHCARDVPSCTAIDNGKCNVLTGKCTCNTGFKGRDCSALDANPCTAAQTTLCDPGGVCHKVGITATCVCNSGYTGTDCDTENPKLSCDDGLNFALTVDPFSNQWVTGTSLVYAAPDKTIGCFTATTSLNKLAFSTGIPCGVATDIGTAGEIKYTVKAILQFQPSKLIRTDIIATLECKFKTSMELISATVTTNYAEGGLISAGPLTVVSTPDLVAKTMHKPNAAGTYALVDEDYQSAIGHIVKLEVELPTTSKAYGKIRFESCTVDDGRDGKGVVTIVTSSCVVPAGLRVLNDLKRISPKKVEVSIIAYLYRGALLQPKLRMKCIVKLCRVGKETDCDDLGCSQAAYTGISDVGAGRKKRAADDQSDVAEVFTVVKKRAADDQSDVAEVSTVVPVRSPFGVNANAQTNAQAVECELSHEFIIVVVVLCVFILLLAAASVFFAMRYIRNRRDKEDDARTVYGVRS